MLLKGKTAIITGASRGIGFETAKLFYKAGARIYVTARSEHDLTSLANSLGNNAVAQVCDVSNLKDWKRVVTRALNETGQIDILINNAGTIDPISNISQTNPEEWSKAVDTNLKGVFYGSFSVIPVMKKKQCGCIINVGSGAAYTPLEGWSHYCASKAGVAMLTRSLKLELKGSGIRVMSLSPGTVATEMQQKIKQSGINAISKMNVSDHVPPSWPARTLLWMCSPGSEKFTHEEISLRSAGIRKRVGLS